MDAATTALRAFYRSLCFQVITAIVIGAALGHFAPSLGEPMKLLAAGPEVVLGAKEAHLAA